MQKLKSDLLEVVKIAIIAIAVNTFVHVFVLMSNKVYSVSMQPNFYEGDLLLTDRAIHWFDGTALGDALNYKYQAGDTVVIALPGKDWLIKRIVALEHQTIMIKQGKVYVDGQQINESYLATNIITSGGSMLLEGETKTVPTGSVFVMGDNRPDSLDSRFYEVGFVKKQHIQGRVQFRILPLTKFGKVQ
jgi:signal peptidase I